MTETAAPENLLRRAMADYRTDPARADFLLECACAQAADPLPLLRVGYKFYNRQRRFELAEEFAGRALAEAGRRCGLPADPADWRREQLPAWDTPEASQALLALKALAFLALRRETPDRAAGHLAILAALDTNDGSGASVVAALAASMTAAGPD